jgi:CTP:molybdopterin cytidylyltransferase MocA
LLAAVILSGGESKRMGSPKALLRLGGETFLEHLRAVTRHERIGVRRVVLGAHAKAIRETVALPDDEVVVNAEWEQGTLSSLQAAIRSLPAGTDGLLLCLVDHPLIGGELVGRLIEAFYALRKKIVLPVCGGRRGHPVIFSAELYGELLAAPMEVGARAVVWAHAEEVAEVMTKDDGCLVNVNDPSAVARLEGKA